MGIFDPVSLIGKKPLVSRVVNVVLGTFLVLVIVIAIAIYWEANNES